MPGEEVLQGVPNLFDVVEIVVPFVEDVVPNPLIRDFKVTLAQHCTAPQFLPGTIPPESREENGPIL